MVPGGRHSTDRTLALVVAVVLGSIPVAVTVADEYEPNDSPDAAPTLSAPGDYTGLDIASGDRDWYAVSLADDETLTATITIAPVDGANLALAVRRDADDDGTVESRLTYSNAYAANETVSVTADGADTYCVDVHHSADQRTALDFGSDGDVDVDDAIPRAFQV
jgi:hypothetical protein